ncbi:thiamine pyrophosphate-binding protein [Vreelandella venusta]|uniref:Thiamine pyrophosphate enzyme N-terminal TPP-binding domain-containing protein n=1 Tax=Vreelandella venusta TaxID=44935 RepID=A0ABX2BEN4_9GAMM|nr:thiamine pyrophosphate-binding protein [Halomonas venusta]AZM97614.1 hypothetical protein EI420_19020 [Halomonas venusta]NPT31050.1 hypothetical protein [Halomonas venusta]UQI40402.1 thiamine pyrophosphate-binding protein [Halomonas venusta]
MPSVAQTLFDGLRLEGVTHVLGIPGPQNLALLDVIRETPALRFIFTRHEQGAAFMAYGYARTRQCPAVVNATEGPGVTNMATPFGATYRGNIPLIGINGLQEEWLREKIKLVAVVINEQGLGNERAFQDAYYDGKHFAVDYQNPDFGILARAFGAFGEKVTRSGDLEAAMQRAFAAEGPHDSRRNDRQAQSRAGAF